MVAVGAEVHLLFCPSNEHVAGLEKLPEGVIAVPRHQLCAEILVGIYEMVV